MAEEAAEQKPDKKSHLPGLLTIAAVVVFEAAIIVGVMLFVGGPSETAASIGDPAMIVEEDEKIVELLVLNGKLPNNRSGVTFLYSTEIYVQVRKKHETPVSDELDRFQNEIKAEIGAIWRTGEPHHFQEPKLENLTRKVYALLHDRFGGDPETEQPIVSKCVIVMDTGFRIDS
jgi:hypothetical protein